MDKVAITNNIRKQRFFHDEMTQKDLAERVGVTRQTIVAIESAKYSPSLELAFRIAHVFGVPLEEVFSAADNQKYADAFLFTYCPISRLSEFIIRTVDFWQRNSTLREMFPRLFLTVIAIRKKMGNDEFVFMRTLEIDSDIVGLWHDLGFVELDDYQSCLESEYNIDLGPDLL